MAANLRYQLLFPQSFSRIYNKTSDSLINRCGGITPLSSRRLSDHASLAQGRRERRNQSSHINYASLERGVTKYYCNRNPRSLELLGMADKPLGFGTKNQRMDYYHRYVSLIWTLISPSSDIEYMRPRKKKIQLLLFSFCHIKPVLLCTQAYVGHVTTSCDCLREPQQRFKGRPSFDKGVLYFKTPPQNI